MMRLAARTQIAARIGVVSICPRIAATNAPPVGISSSRENCLSRQWAVKLLVVLTFA